jgi:predicted DNA-binding transcriptional regulator YafY
MQTEYGLPIKYSTSEKGYYLTDPDFKLDVLPPGKDELVALFLLKDAAESLDAEDLNNSIDLLWRSITSGNKSLRNDLRKLTQVFSSDFTAVGTMADLGILDLLNAASTGETVELEYESPWRHNKPKKYIGKIEHVHLSDATVYLLFKEHTGRSIVLNASNILSFQIVTENPPSSAEPIAHSQSLADAKNWLSGFGIWANEEMHSVEIDISSPASKFYSKQRWHPAEENIQNDGFITKKFQSIISPELVRRILSIGSYIRDIRPKALKDMVTEELRKMSETLST